MSLPLVDIILLIIIGIFAIKGFASGLIKSVLSIIGLVVSIYVASRYYEPMADFIVRITGWGENVSNVVMFVIAFIFLNALVSLAFWILEKFFNIILFLPFMTTMNRLLGFIFGAIEGALGLGIILYFIERFPFGGRFLDLLAASSVAPYLSGMTILLLPLLPSAVRLIESSIDYVENQVR